MKEINEIKHKVLDKFKPNPKLSVADWAEQNFVLSPEYGSTPGLISLKITPYLREILNTINDPSIDRITWVASAQVAKTTALLIAAAYFISYDPAPILFLEPSDKLAKGIATERFSAVIRDNKYLKYIFDSKETTDNQVIKIFPGGTLIFGSAASVSDLISRPIRVLFLDETDAYTADLKQKGNPIKMAEDRTTTFHNRKIITVSTPGIEGCSNVMDSYNRSDMRVFKTPCPYCNHYQELHFAGLKKQDPDNTWKNAGYKCEACNKVIQEYQKAEMVSNGIWVATNDNPIDKKHAGFKINQLYSLFPNTTWESIGERLHQAKRKNDINDLKTFFNQVLAETWSDQHINNVSDTDLINKAEYYKSEVPMDVGLLTAGIDFQADRAEVTVLGHAKNQQIYLIDHRVFYGDPAIDPDAPNATLYRDLDTYLNHPFKHESGRDIYINTIFADVGDGNRTHIERKWCFARIMRKIFAIMGSRLSNDIGFSGKFVKDSNTKHPIYFVGTQSLKTDIYHRLQLTRTDQPGYIHFPKLPHINDDYFKQLTAEKLTEKRESGVIKTIWTKKYNTQRNEALDCFVYALAAYHKEIGPNTAIIDQLVDSYAIPVSTATIDKETELIQEQEDNTPAFDFYAEKNKILPRYS